MTEVNPKTCKGCNIPRSFAFFGPKKDGKFGLNSKCFDCRKKESIEYRIDNQEKCNAYSKRKYYEKHEQSLEKSKKYYENNSKTLRLKNKERSKKNRKKISAQALERSKIDNLFKFKRYVRSMVNLSYRRRNLKKTSKTENIIGCSVEFLKNYIESKFLPGMTWDNHGMFGWHIDHIKPLALANNVEDVVKLSHYTNLQPLWAEDNLKKSDKIVI